MQTKRVMRLHGSDPKQRQVSMAVMVHKGSLPENLPLGKGARNGYAAATDTVSTVVIQFQLLALEYSSIDRAHVLFASTSGDKAQTR